MSGVAINPLSQDPEYIAIGKGKEAGRRGEIWTNNPYPRGSDTAKAWEFGRYSAQLRAQQRRAKRERKS